MNDAQRDWIEIRDEHICKVLEDASNDLMLEAMWWLSQVKWERDKMAGLAAGLVEYGKPEALIDTMRQAYKDWCT